MIHQTQMARRGFAFVLALLVLPVVGIAITVLVAAASDEARRTFSDVRHAQLEQMLLAAASDTPAHLNPGATTADQSWNVELPQSLLLRGGVLKADVAKSDLENQRALLVHAELDGLSADQTLRFEREAGGWRLMAAELVAD